MFLLSIYLDLNNIISYKALLSVFNVLGSDGLKKVVYKLDNLRVPIKNNARASVTPFVWEYNCDTAKMTLVFEDLFLRYWR